MSIIFSRFTAVKLIQQKFRLKSLNDQLPPKEPFENIFNFRIRLFTFIYLRLLPKKIL